jgi:hypothetical protein
MKKIFLILITIVMLTGISWGFKQALAQSGTGNEEYFENGHRLSGEFLRFYYQSPNPQLLYGNPITDAYVDSTTENIVQYFGKARFELHPEEPNGSRVKLSPLGYYMYQKNEGKPLPVGKNPTACLGFPGNEYSVCYAFRDFFEANGGVNQFGEPLGNHELYGNLIVQYFNNARFEWHQELPEGKKVLLSNLGLQYFLLRGEDRSRLLPKRNAQNYENITRLESFAFVTESVKPFSGNQTIYIVVQDQKQMPVPNADVMLVVQMPDGSTEHFEVPVKTNLEGIIKYTFPYQSNYIGIVQIWTVVYYKQLKSETQTSFRIWF